MCTSSPLLRSGKSQLSVATDLGCNAEDDVVTPRIQWATFDTQGDVTPRGQWDVDLLQKDGALKDSVTPRVQWNVDHIKEDEVPPWDTAPRMFERRHGPPAWQRERTPSPENYYHPMLQQRWGNEDPCKELQKPDNVPIPRTQFHNEAPSQPVCQKHVEPAAKIGQPKERPDNCRPQRMTVNHAPLGGESSKLLQEQRVDSLPDVSMASEKILSIALLLGSGSVPSAPVAPKEMSDTRTRTLSIASFLDSRVPPPPVPSAPVPPVPIATISIASLISNSDSTSANKRGDATFNGSSNNLVSMGTVGHPHACGDACKYAQKPRGCKDGMQCRRCHLCKWRKYG